MRIGIRIANVGIRIRGVETLVGHRAWISA